MDLSNAKLIEYSKKLSNSKKRIFNQNGFFGRLLLYVKFQLDESVETAATDGENIIWAPSFLDKLSDLQTDIVMMHEIMHIVLQHCSRGNDFDHERFNIACDIVINSILLETMNITESDYNFGDIGQMVYELPDGESGANYTAEEVYRMLGQGLSSGTASIEIPGDGEGSGDGAGSGDEEGFSNREDSGVGEGSGNGDEPRNGKNYGSKGSSENKNDLCNNKNNPCNLDDHSRWNNYSDKADMSDKWQKRITDIAEEIRISNPSSYCGLVPEMIQRMIEELKTKNTDWRSILDAFVQEDVCDYSFNPPDRRFDGQDFFLPDFNEKEESVKNILFMIDASGSMSDNMITDAFAEIKSAIDQFSGKLEGFLGFFDADVESPVPFENVDDLISIKPVGGGGTDFSIIFEYVEKEMSCNPPDSIVILTDGYADFPNEEAANGIPVLWMINNNEIDPPWGQVARMDI